MAPRVPELNSRPARPRPLAEVARTWAEGVDFRRGLRGLEVARTKAPTTGPEAVQRAYALHRTWEDGDLGSTRLLRVPVEGRTLFAIHTRTDGDDGFLELFSDRGALLASGVVGLREVSPGRFSPTITWDDEPGAVRERLAPRGVAPEIEAFHAGLEAARAEGSPLGRTISAGEVRTAVAPMVGPELTTSSIDGFENAAIHRMLADGGERLTHGARSFAAGLGRLYLDQQPRALRKLADEALGAAIERPGAFGEAARLATAEVKGRRQGPKVSAFVELTRAAWGLLPSHVVPATRAEAVALLREAGGTAAAARATVEHLAGEDRRLYTAKIISAAGGGWPKLEGVAILSSSEDGKKVAAAFVPRAPDGAGGAEPRELVRGLTGVDREVEVLERAPIEGGERLDLAWRPTWGGRITARLTVPAGEGEVVASGLVAQPAREPMLAAALRERLAPAHGPVELLGWIGRDNNQGPGFWVAHRPEGHPGPARLSEIRIRLGGEATITPKVLGARDEAAARDLAVQLARAHAEDMVSDPELAELARLEVALRTGWTQPADLVSVDPGDSPVGFDPATERFQLMLPSVWGDNAVVVTFAKDGTLRVEDLN